MKRERGNCKCIPGHGDPANNANGAECSPCEKGSFLMGVEPRWLDLGRYQRGVQNTRWTDETWQNAVRDFGMIYYEVMYEYIQRNAGS